MRLLGLSSLAFIVLASSSASQTVQTGSRVRVVASSLPGGVGVGHVIAVSGDSLIVDRDRSGGVARLARGDVSSIQVSAGRHRHTGRGALLGVLIGAGSGAVVGAVTWAPCTGFCLLEPQTRAANAALGAGVFGTMGALVGTVAGALSVSDQWQNVTVRPTVGLNRSEHGADAGTFGIHFSRSF
jgi:hypothetical protein